MSARTGGRRAISISALTNSASAASCTSWATCRSRTYRSSTTWRRCSCFRRSTRASVFPLIEAMACGTPVITANSSSLGRDRRWRAETVDPRDVDALTAAIVTLATRCRPSCGACRERGLARAQGVLVVTHGEGDARAVQPRRIRSGAGAHAGRALTGGSGRRRGADATRRPRLVPRESHRDGQGCTANAGARRLRSSGCRLRHADWRRDLPVASRAHP